MIRIKRRPIFFWVLLAVFTGSVVWWSVYVPFKPDGLYAAIPQQAALVSEHRDLAGRWPELSRNPLAQSIFTSLGVQPADLKQFSDNPSFRSWLQRLAGRDVVLAYVPDFGMHQEQAWLVSSWLGGQSQQLRWLLSSGRVPGFKTCAPYGGRLVWRVDSPFLKSSLKLTITLVEGMLLACFSENIETIYSVLDTYDGLAPSVLSQPGFRLSSRWCSEPLSPDRGWINLPLLRHQPEFRPAIVSYEVVQATAKHMEGGVCGAYPLPPMKPGGGAGPRTSDLERLFGDLPIAMVIGRSNMLVPMMGGQLPLSGALLLQVIQQQKSGTLALALFGEEYGGRYRGLRMPGLVLGVSTKNAETVLPSLRWIMDTLNAKYQWGLIPREVSAGSRTVYAIEGTGTNDYARLPLEEKGAYAACGNWLLLSSNLQTLTNLLARYDRPEAASQARHARWLKGLLEADAPVYGWVDFARGEKTARLALMGYSLKLLAQDPEGSKRQRQSLNEAKAWIEALMPLESCQLWLRSDGQTSELKFKAGSEK